MVEIHGYFSKGRGVGDWLFRGGVPEDCEGPDVGFGGGGLEDPAVGLLWSGMKEGLEGVASHLDGVLGFLVDHGFHPAVGGSQLGEDGGFPLGRVKGQGEGFWGYEVWVGSAVGASRREELEGVAEEVFEPL